MYSLLDHQNVCVFTSICHPEHYVYVENRGECEQKHVQFLLGSTLFPPFETLPLPISEAPCPNDLFQPKV